MQKQLVYTRTIENPIAGGKLTGKVGGLNLGYLGAIDETFSAGSPDVYVNLVRLRGDLGASSTIGAVYTDRTVSATKFNRVAGADARLQFGGRYTFSLIGAQSFTNHDDFDERLDGAMFSTRIERAGRSFSFNAELEDTQADFVPGSGFFQRLGTAQVNGRVNYTWFGQRGALLEQISPSIETKAYWQHDRFWDGERALRGRGPAQQPLRLQEQHHALGEREVLDVRVPAGAVREPLRGAARRLAAALPTGSGALPGSA